MGGEAVDGRLQAPHLAQARLRGGHGLPDDGQALRGDVQPGGAPPVRRERPRTLRGPRHRLLVDTCSRVARRVHLQRGVLRLGPVHEAQHERRVHHRRSHDAPGVQLLHLHQVEPQANGGGHPRRRGLVHRSGDPLPTQSLHGLLGERGRRGAQLRLARVRPFRVDAHAERHRPLARPSAVRKVPPRGVAFRTRRQLHGLRVAHPSDADEAAGR
mmetsp:Transcript_1631/g.4673  ORF Transcript_1631/g.4673 Transcript_1631/m.4673 type:complete len:214 (-) Transcript_1631:905-1546(-)